MCVMPKVPGIRTAAFRSGCWRRLLRFAAGGWQRDETLARKVLYGRSSDLQAASVPVFLSSRLIAHGLDKDECDYFVETPCKFARAIVYYPSYEFWSH